MSVLIWNVRSLNKRVRRQDVIDHIAKYPPSFVGLVETKVKLQHSNRITSCIRNAWSSSNNCQFFNHGSIWVSGIN